MVAWLSSQPDAWDPYLVAAGLGVLTEVREDTPEWHYEGRILARGAAQLLRFHERLAPVIGVREAALAVFAATAMLTHPVTIDGATFPSGSWILDRLCTLFLDAPVGETVETEGGEPDQ
ncbi:hypothetical protein [Streptomyces sp. NPDC093089]|uniref:hypothetical protein n=1 Tax=Streptomyces sp. NPDC093089 TaxID=3366024 RepID=UPI0038099650